MIRKAIVAGLAAAVFAEARILAADSAAVAPWWTPTPGPDLGVTQSLPGIPIVPGIPIEPGIPVTTGVPSPPGIPVTPGIPITTGIDTTPGGGTTTLRELWVQAERERQTRSAQ